MNQNISKYLYSVMLLTLILCVIFPGILCSGDTKSDNSDTSGKSQHIIATIDNASITVETFQKEVIRRGGHLAGRFDTLEEREELLAEMIRFEVLAAKAKKAGYDQDPEIIKSMKKLMVQKFWQDQAAFYADKMKVSDEEVKEYYDEHINDYTGPEMARAAIIFLKFPVNASREDREKLQEKAESILKLAKQAASKEASFGELAKKYSEDRASRDHSGDMGWIPKDAKLYKWDKTVIDAIFSLKAAGDISSIVSASKGLCILKLMDKKQGIVKDLSQVTKEIRRKLSFEKRRSLQEEYYQSIKEEFVITTDHKLLNSIDLKQRGSTGIPEPPSFPIKVRPETEM